MKSRIKNLEAQYVVTEFMHCPNTLDEDSMPGCLRKHENLFYHLWQNYDSSLCLFSNMVHNLLIFSEAGNQTRIR